MKCCGQDVETPFCPMCGSAQQTPGATLLADIQIRVRQCQNAVCGEWGQTLKGWRDFILAAIKAQSETNSLQTENAKLRHELEAARAVNALCPACVKSETNSKSLFVWECAFCDSKDYQVTHRACCKCGAMNVIPTPT